jgi:CRP-like cAMP-binding protein
MAGAIRLVTLTHQQTIFDEGQEIDHVLFPETAVIGLVAGNENGEHVEAGMLGWEGCTDMVLQPGHDRAAYRTVVQIEGTAWHMQATDYASVLARSHDTLRVMLRFQQVTSTQLIYTSLANASLTVPQRLARWLLMTQDRVGAEISTVQDWLALVLCVTRTSIVNAVQVLRDKGAIEAERGKITILSRKTLLTLCGGAYGQPEAEYERVLGPFRKA